MDLTSYNILSRIFEFKVYDITDIDKIIVSLPHIITDEEAQLLGYNNGWFEATNTTRIDNIMSDYFDNEGLFLIASKKLLIILMRNKIIKVEMRVESEFQSVSLQSSMDKTFSIIIRVDEPTNAFNVDMSRYCMGLDILHLSLDKPTNVLYITLILLEKPSFSINNILSHFKLDSTMFRTIDSIEMVLSDTNIKLK